VERDPVGWRGLTPQGRATRAQFVGNNPSMVAIIEAVGTLGVPVNFIRLLSRHVRRRGPKAAHARTRRRARLGADGAMFSCGREASPSTTRRSFCSAKTRSCASTRASRRRMSTSTVCQESMAQPTPANLVVWQRRRARREAIATERFFSPSRIIAILAWSGVP